MKSKKIKNLVLMFVLIICFAMLVSCGKKKENKDNAGNDGNAVKKEVTNNQEQNETKEPVESPVATSEDNDGATSGNNNALPAPENKKELPIYTINKDTLEKEDYTAMVSEDSQITAEFIVNEVVKKFEQNGLTIGINSVIEKGDTIIVDFQSDKAPFVNVGSGVEATILDCIAQSLVDNLEGHNKVIYRKDGKAYESGHEVLGFDEVYLKD